MQCVASIKYNLCVRENSVCLHVHVCLCVPEFWHFLHGVTVCHPCMQTLRLHSSTFNIQWHSCSVEVIASIKFGIVLLILSLSSILYVLCNRLCQWHNNYESS